VMASRSVISHLLPKAATVSYSAATLEPFEGALANAGVSPAGDGTPRAGVGLYLKLSW
jgi:hypothetical protein